MIKLPENINQEMKMWRMGLTGMPKSYIDFHADKAQKDIDARNTNEFVVVEDKGLQSDGWGDGMKVRMIVAAVREDGEWKVETLKWHESGAWFRRGAGWSRFLEMVK